MVCIGDLISAAICALLTSYIRVSTASALLALHARKRKCAGSTAYTAAGLIFVLASRARACAAIISGTTCAGPTIPAWTLFAGALPGLVLVILSSALHTPKPVAGIRPCLAALADVVAVRLLARGAGAHASRPVRTQVRRGSIARLALALIRRRGGRVRAGRAVVLILLSVLPWATRNASSSAFVSSWAALPAYFVVRRLSNTTILYTGR